MSFLPADSQTGIVFAHPSTGGFFYYQKIKKMTENSQQYWNSVANSWERFGDLSQHVEKYVDSKITKYLNTQTTGQVLNLGSGSGDRYLSSFKDKVVHVDYSPNMLKANHQGRKVEADVRNSLPFSIQSFESATAFFLMRYLTLDQQVALIKNTLSLLKEGGVLIIVDIPDNKHQFQVEIFDPEILASHVATEALVLEANTEIENVGKYISTGFGGWYERGSYKISTLVVQKSVNNLSIY